ncbi:hypothetical protein ACHAPT_012707 [Fusarium lateritium]
MSTSPPLDPYDPVGDYDRDRERDQSPYSPPPRLSHPLDPGSSTSSELTSVPAHATGHQEMNKGNSKEPPSAPKRLSPATRQPNSASPFSTGFASSKPPADSAVTMPSSLGSGSGAAGPSTTMSYFGQSMGLPSLRHGYASGMRDAPRSGTAHFPRPTSPLVTVLIRRLPLNTTIESVRYMTLFCEQHLVNVELLPPEQSADHGFVSALLQFRSPTHALEAQQKLHGSTIVKDNKLIVEILPHSNSGSTRQYTTTEMAAVPSSSAVSTTSSSSTAGSRLRGYGGPSSLLETLPPLSNGIYAGHELPNPDQSAAYQTLFSPQSPIGNHVTESGRISGKTLIANNSGDDEDTNVILKDPVAFAQYNDAPRRKTDPDVPVQAMGGLSINTNNTIPSGPSSLPPHMGVMSPRSFRTQQPQQRGPYPAVNPADQNPPCNTLYVGNLPIDTSEEELKALFSKQRGYKRLCFRSKGNGPMCFVEFEEVSFATKALSDLYGHLLHNSVKGGIRLSFSKNPLGVRSNPNPNHGNAGVPGGMHGAMPVSGNGFAGAHRFPPGLAAPPGLGGGHQQHYNNGNYHQNASMYGYNGPQHNGHGGLQRNGHIGLRHNGHVSPQHNGVNSSYSYQGHGGAESNGMSHVNGANSTYGYNGYEPNGYEPNGVNLANAVNPAYPYNVNANAEPRAVNGVNAFLGYNGSEGVDTIGANGGNALFEYSNNHAGAESSNVNPGNGIHAAKPIKSPYNMG